MRVTKKLLSLLFAAVFAVAALGACGDDDSGDTGDTTTADTGGDTGDDGGDDTGGGDEGGGDDDGGGDDGGDGGSANPDVEAYCDAVAEFVANFDPNNPDTGTAGQELAQQGQELATSDLTAEDAQRIGECTQELAQIATG
jgi:hypothetical protein